MINISKDREGSEHDVKRLVELFKEFKFEFFIWEKPSKSSDKKSSERPLSLPPRPKPSRSPNRRQNTVKG